MATAKEQVEEMLRSLPNDCTFEDIQYRIYLLESIQAGLDSLADEPTFTQEEIAAEFGQEHVG